MIQPQAFPSGFAIFCDDIREEVGGKLTFVGSYGSELQVQAAAPAIIGQLCALISYKDDPTTLPKKLTLKVFLDSEEERLELLSADINAPAIDVAPDPDDPDAQAYAELRVNWSHSGLIINKDSKVRIRVYEGDNEYRVGSLNIKLVPPAAGAEL